MAVGTILFQLRHLLSAWFPQPRCRCAVKGAAERVCSGWRRNERAAAAARVIVSSWCYTNVAPGALQELAVLPGGCKISHPEMRHVRGGQATFHQAQWNPHQGHSSIRETVGRLQGSPTS